jgi:hypothetical protein
MLFDYNTSLKGTVDKKEDVCRYCMSLGRREVLEFKGEALDGTVWRTRFGRDFGHVVRQIKNRMNE